MAETGAGILLSDEHGRVTAAQLRAALDKVLHDASYRQQAERIGETLRAAGGYQRAVEEIEAFVGVRQPQRV